MSATDTISDPEALTGDYTFDAAHTTFGFVARHAMVTKVRGSFGEFEGSAHLDFTDPSKSSVSVKIKAASIDTGQRRPGRPPAQQRLLRHGRVPGDHVRIDGDRGSRCRDTTA